LRTGGIMMSTYEEAVSWIHSRLKLGIKPGLKRMEWFMEKLGHPERRLRAIHIAGTNGKGSTVWYLRNILNEAGYKVGTFTSPYVESFNERISVNGQPIDDQDLIKLVEKIKPLTEELEKTELGSPTEFEVITAMAIYYFAKINIPDFVIFETGLGGRLDSTNIIHPILTIITNVGFDHTHILGDSIQKIAFEKAGIIKPGVPLITAVEQPEAIQVLCEKAKDARSTIYRLGEEFTITQHQSFNGGEQFSVETPFIKFNDLTISMLGAHQVKNAALAVMAANYLYMYYSLIIEEEHIRDGLIKTKWIGRFEQLSENPHVIIDGAHNREGIVSLVQTVKSHLEKKKIHVIFSALKDKNVDEMVCPLTEIAQSITFTSFSFPRAYSAEELYQVYFDQLKNISFEEDWRSAIETKLKQLTENETLLITGSLYFISEIRRFFTKTINI
jgi:dihydrofolate synthase / folylpolyglutamate synthase